MTEALRALREGTASGCVVLGEPSYYCRFGFRSELSLVLPNVPPEYFQVISFKEEMPRGIVSYDASFSANA
jgi:putative acetyltransferase